MNTPTSLRTRFLHPLLAAGLFEDTAARLTALVDLGQPVTLFDFAAGEALSLGFPSGDCRRR